MPGCGFLLRALGRFRCWKFVVPVVWRTAVSGDVTCLVVLRHDFWFRVDGLSGACF